MATSSEDFRHICDDLSIAQEINYHVIRTSSSERITQIATALRNNRGLTSLTLDVDEPFEGSAKLEEILSLSEVLKKPTLQKLSLGGFILKNTKVLVDGLKNPTLQFLHLQHLTLIDTKSLYEALETNSSLREAHFHSVQGAEPLLLTLAKKKTLQVLWFSAAKPETETIIKLSEILRWNNTLVELTLKIDNVMTIRGMQALALAIKENFTLRKLNLDCKTQDVKIIFDTIQTFLQRNIKLHETQRAREGKSRNEASMIGNAPFTPSLTSIKNSSANDDISQQLLDKIAKQDIELDRLRRELREKDDYIAELLKNRVVPPGGI